MLLKALGINLGVGGIFFMRVSTSDSTDQSFGKYRPWRHHFYRRQIHPVGGSVPVNYEALQNNKTIAVSEIELILYFLYNSQFS